MNRFKLFLSITILFTLICCKENKIKTIPKPKVEAIKKPIEKIKKSWDSLKRHNVEAFFTEYAKTNKETKVLIKTKFGDIKLRLFNDTPIHRANFVFLTKIKYFDTTVFYRVDPKFVVQGGNSDEYHTMKQRQKYGNYLIKPEFKSHRKHKFGTLAAARHWENNPNKLSSPFEFYIVINKKGAPHLDNEHTVFGEVISGYSTIDKISKVKTDIKEWPLKDIKMTVEVIE
jgi:peptidylprolyl isomerase